MTDISALGIKVTSSGVVKTAEELTAFSKAAKAAGDSAKKPINIKVNNAGIAKVLADIEKMDRALASIGGKSGAAQAIAKIDVANNKAAISAQNLAAATARSEAAQNRAAIAAQSLIAATLKTEAAQGRAAAAAQAKANAVVSAATNEAAARDRISQMVSRSIAQQEAEAAAIASSMRKTGPLFEAMAGSRAMVSRQNEELRKTTQLLNQSLAEEERAARAAANGGKAYSAEVARLKAQLEPTWAALEKYRQSVELLRKAKSEGAITEQQYREQIRLTKAEYQNFVSTGAKVTQTSGAMRAGMQNLSYQVNDVATMFALGARPMQIFASQGGQVVQAVGQMTQGTKGLAGFLGGPWGLMIMTATVALSPFIAKLFDTRDALEDVRQTAEEAMKALYASLNQASAISNAATKATKELVTAQADLAKANRDLADTESLADQLARTPGAAQAAAAAYQRLGAIEQDRLDAQKRLADAQRDLNAVRDISSTVIPMQQRNQEILNATEKEARVTKARLTDAEKAAIKASKDAQREYEQAAEAAAAYSASLEDQAAKFGLSSFEIRRMEVAAKAAAIEAAGLAKGTAGAAREAAELARSIRAAAAALEAKEIAKAADDWNLMIAAMYDELEVSALVAEARRTGSIELAEQAKILALQQEKQSKFVEWRNNALVASLNTEAEKIEMLNQMWFEYSAARLAGIHQESMIERDIRAAQALHEHIDAIIHSMSRMGGLGGILGDIGFVLTDRNPLAALLSRGGIGTLLGTIAGGQRPWEELGVRFEASLNRTFGVSGPFAKSLGQTLSNVFQGAATGSAVHSVIGGSSSGSQVGGSLGAVAGSIIPGVGTIVGSIVGSVLGSVFGGMFSSTKRGGATFSGSGANLGVGGTWGNSDQRISGASQIANAAVDALEKIAGALDATVGSFTGSVSIREGNLRYDPTGQGISKTSKGAINFGQDEEALLKAIIADAISDGVFEGMSEAVERLLSGPGDIEAQLEKALSFQTIISEVEKLRDPIGAAVAELDKQFAYLETVFNEAQASVEERAMLDEWYAHKLSEINEQVASANETNTKQRELEIALMTLQGDFMGALAKAREAELASLPESLRVLQEQVWAEELLAQKRTLQIELMRAEGDVAGAVAAQRDIERAAMHESLRPMQDRIWALQDEAQAAAEAAEAARAAAELDRTRRSMEADLLDLQGKSSEALAIRRKMEVDAIDATLQPLLRMIHALQDQASAADAAASALQRTQSLQLRLLRAQGDETGAIALERQIELAGALTDAERDLLQQIYAAEEAAAARAASEAARAAMDAANRARQEEARRAAEEAAKRAEEIAQQRRAMEIELMRLQGRELEALRIEREAHLLTLDKSLHALQHMIWAEQDLAQAREDAAKKVEDARSALTQAYEREASALNQTIDKFRGLSEALREFRSGLFAGEGFDQFLTLQNRLAQTSALANTGQEEALRDLPGVARDFLSASYARATSRADYMMDVGRVANIIDQAIGAADDVVDYNELQLEALDRSVEGMVEVRDEIISVRHAIDELKEAIREQDANMRAGQEAIASNTGKVAKYYDREARKPAEVNN